MGGDLAYADGHESEKWVIFFEQWSEHMRSGDRLIPIVAAIGTHESDRELHGMPEEAPFSTLFLIIRIVSTPTGRQRVSFDTDS